MSDLIQHVELGQSRVALQYSQSPKFLAYLAALLKHADELEGVLRDVALQMDIDVAEGVNLDVLGDLIGITRILPASMQMTFFGFSGYANAGVFGEEGLSYVGARFKNESESGLASTVLDDAEYRLLLRAKIIKNHARCTGEDVLAGIQSLFNSPHVYVYDCGQMAFGISIGRPLSFSERAILNFDILARASAVQLAWIIVYNVTNYFGFDGQIGAKPFGEEGTPSIGGQLAEEF